MDNVRVAKLLGGGLHDSTIVQGMVLKTHAVGSINRMEKAKVSSLILTMTLFIGLLKLFLTRDSGFVLS